jgi:MFS family permease
MVILPEVSPDHLKHHISSLIGVVLASAGVLGPVLGGVLTHLTTWRWIFWIKFVTRIYFAPCLTG